MKLRLCLLSALFCCLLNFLSIALSQETAERLYQSALYKEEVDGNLSEAIKLYKQGVEKFPKNKPIVAKALFHLALCSERLEDESEAIASYQKIVDQFSDQRDVASRAKERLSVLLKEKELRESKAIAVLPFKNMNNDAESEYFSDGFTEELTTQLSKIRELKVISFTSSIGYKKTDESPTNIARALGVGNIVEGSVGRAGDRVRISAQLIKTSTNEYVWTDSYDRNLSDILTLQRDLARLIARQIKVTLSPQEETRLASVSAVNSEAHELYLKGRFYWNKRTADFLEKSIDYFNRAIEKDPNYALAYAGLARSYAALGASETLGIAPGDAMLKAKEAALKAVELDPNLPDAHIALGLVKVSFEWDWQAAERDFQRALELDPNSVAAHHWYSHLLMVLGQEAESLRLALRGLELDPVNGQMHIHLAWYYLITRHYDKLLESYRKTIELFPDDPIIYAYLAQAYSHQGKHELAIIEAKKAVELSRNNPHRLTTLAFVYASMGKEGEARAVLKNLTETSRYVSPLSIASIYLALGDKPAALRSLEKAYEDRVAQMAYLKVDAHFDSLSSDPRFQDLLRRMNLPD